MTVLEEISKELNISDYVLLVILEEKNGEFEFKKVDLNEFSKDKNSKYLYKRGSSNKTRIETELVLFLSQV